MTGVLLSNSSHYVASKHGMIGLPRDAALEYGSERIRINTICPGFIEPPLLTNAGITENMANQKLMVLIWHNKK